jgi:diaminohydroxyphosphoribosylaminopyrimidine deaminase/5-amino-6-(5-phosphoribosylamino)uracil reductase
MEAQERYMRRCIELGQLGLGAVSPNPLVGCVIVHDDRIIGEGWHRSYGKAHAETEALDDCRRRGRTDDLAASTLYVNLEPCSHHGKTPPCAERIIAAGIPRVVIGMQDPFEKVCGNGIRMLKAAGIDVTVGVLEKEALELNRRFVSVHTRQRPYVIFKFARSFDGFIAPLQPGAGSQISNRYSRILVHKWRSEEDAILAGGRTVLRDNPRLTVREWTGRNPLRVSADEHGSFPGHLHVLDGSAPTLILTPGESRRQGRTEFVSYSPGDALPVQILKALSERHIQSVLVEGGRKLIDRFVDGDLWDEARIFTAPHTLREGTAAPQVTGRVISHEPVGDDWLTVLRNTR